MNNQLAIEYIKITALKPYRKNARLHSDANIESIARSISLFGFNDPIAVDENNGIIEGHGRILAAQQLGIEALPALRLMHMTAVEQRAYILAHNKIPESSEWDIELLETEVQAIEEANLNIDFLGFDLSTLEPGDDFQTGTDGAHYEKPEPTPSMSVPVMIELTRPQYLEWKAIRAGYDSDIEALLR